jgi:hypothetical protein
VLPDYARLCIEYDGGTHRESLAADNQRQNRLVGAGYELLPIPPPTSIAAPTRSSPKSNPCSAGGDVRHTGVQTAEASWRRTWTVSSQPRQPSVTLCP